MSGSEVSQSILKWQTRSRIDTATRVRNNQRRHRARVKSYIVELEHKLMQTQQALLETQERLDQITKVHNDQLVRSCKRCKQRMANAAERRKPPLAEPDLPNTSNSNEQNPFLFTALEDKVQSRPILRDRKVVSTQQDNIPTNSGQVSTIPKLSYAHSSPCASQTTSTWTYGEVCCEIVKEKLKISEREYSPRMQSSIIPLLPQNQFIDDTRSGTEYFARSKHLTSIVSDLQAPEAHESTTQCRSAFQMIEQHNIRGLDMSIVYTRLMPGFRLPRNEQDDCHVENKILFALLDFVSEAW